MLGRYAIETEKGTLMLEIFKQNKKILLTAELLKVGYKVRLDVVSVTENTIVAKSVFFMFPQDVRTISLVFDGANYTANGSIVMVGEVKGRVIPFTGKTRFEQMLEELPFCRTGKIVQRTEDEIATEVHAVIKKMRLEEKIGQMSQAAGANTAAIGGAVQQKMSIDEMIEKGFIGSAISVSSLENVYAQQKIAVEKSRLGIPLMFCQDVIHGYQTVFPIPLAWACSFNPELIGKAGRVAAKEVTPNGIMFAFAPMLDIARDPRWGRVSEGNGEDPYLCARICEAQVRGYQGESLLDDDSMIACLKHFVGYSAAEAGRDYNTCEITETTLRNIYLPPFRSGINAGAGSVMNSFNTMNSVPVAINKRILNDLLRTELGFEGIVVSDYAAIEECIAHGAVEDDADAARKAVEASMDIEMATSLYNSTLAQSVKDGKLSEKLIDECVARILTYKYKTGLMDDPYKYIQPENLDKIYGDEYLAVSHALARESIVLLKNNGILPLDKNKKIAIIGPKADSTDLLGPWQFSQYLSDTVTLKQGLQAKGANISTEVGCAIHEEIDGGIERAVRMAKNSDMVLLALGEDASMSGEAASRQSIEVPVVQMRLAKAVAATGTPVVLVLTNGRPLLLDWFEENVDAIVETWFLGSQAGHAIADILVGEYNPSGKLSITFPRSLGQVPIYYNHLNTGRPYKDGMQGKFLSRYIDGPNTPLYPFGFGLSYTDFEVSELMISHTEMTNDSNIKATVKLTNKGKIAGTETIQLYLRDVAASIARPVKELKGFAKISLKPSATQEVSFIIDEPMLRFFNVDNKEVSEAGKFELMIGKSSDDKDLCKVEFMLKN